MKGWCIFHTGFVSRQASQGADLQMMKTLNLNEGDPIRLTGAELKKGKMVKIQAQSVDFLEVGDAKAVYVYRACCGLC
jgi:ubiquitin fusion degradation protein 1